MTFTVVVIPLAAAATIAVPVLVVLVNVTSAIPLALVTALAADKDPSVVEKSTVAPGMGFPPVSVNVARIKDVLVPLATMLVGLAVRANPPVMVSKIDTSTDCVMLPAVADNKTSPSVVPAIRDVVTVPDALGVLTVMEVIPLENLAPAGPDSMVNTTGVPKGTGLFAVSLTTAVMAEELALSFGRLVGLADRAMEPTETVPSLMMI